MFVQTREKMGERERGEGGREGEGTERERETDRQTERQTDRQRIGKERSREKRERFGELEVEREQRTFAARRK